MKLDPGGLAAGMEEDECSGHHFGRTRIVGAEVGCGGAMSRREVAGDGNN